MKKSRIISKRDLINELNADVVSKQIKDVVDVVKDELGTSDEEAKTFIKDLSVNEDEDSIANRSIEYGQPEPELGPEVQDVKLPKGSKIKYSEKSDSKNDLPFEGVVKEGRKVYKVKNLRNE
jgi:hypothetical protein